jgi:outer membrane protein
MPLVEPNPADIVAWTDVALEQNLTVAAARYALETARDEIKRRNAGHFPTLDLVGSHDYSSSGGGNFGGNRTRTDAVGLRLAVPVFEGGATESQVREARHLYDQAAQTLEEANRSAHRQSREAYRGVVDSIATTRALKQALVSTETALRAIEAGFDAGTRTTVDVLDALRATFEARSNYKAARYRYVLNTLSLKQAAGTLSDNDLAAVNDWLE